MADKCLKFKEVSLYQDKIHMSQQRRSISEHFIQEDILLCRSVPVTSMAEGVRT